MPEKIHVRLGRRSYDITVGRGLPVGRQILSEPGAKAMIVSDSNVGPVYGLKCERELRAGGVETHAVAVPAGEA